jgi:hypothetical protein
MKTFLFMATLILGLQAQARGTGDVGSADDPQFSAFVNGSTLYVTVLGDSCNRHFGNLKVDGLCQAGRMTQNYAETCDAEVSVSTTRMFCNDQKRVPRVVEINLAESHITHEAKVLNLTYQGKTIEVNLQK